MNWWEQLERLWNSLRQLGTRRLTALAIIGGVVFGVVAGGSYYLSRPDMEVLYSGLSQIDASRIGAALGEAGISFDLSTDGTTVMVPYGKTAQARMLLAEKGLPASATAGYELFDKLGPVGLTSFMQDITRIRALEGELARTIQTMKGVKAARVHIVLQDGGSFRRSRQHPTASVVVRTEGRGTFTGAQAIRQLVAAAVPGLAPDQVTVLDTTGAILAAGGDTIDTAPQKMVELEKAIGRELQENVRKTLVPYLGLNNFEISVAARLNTDKRQTNETLYDPDSRVERSTKSVKETSSSENAGGQGNVTVGQNIPTEQTTGATGGERSKRNSDRREELSNFELSTKTVNTVSTGYKIENLTIAVVVNRKQLLASLGKDAKPEAMENRLKELEDVVSTAAGLDTARGDRVTVAAVDFISEVERLEPVPPMSIVEQLLRLSGNFINAGAFIIATLLLLWFGVRPAVRALKPTVLEEAVAERAGVPLALEAAAPGAPPVLAGEALPTEAAELEKMIEERESPIQRLEHALDTNEKIAVALLKQWMRGE